MHNSLWVRTRNEISSESIQTLGCCIRCFPGETPFTDIKLWKNLNEGVFWHLPTHFSVAELLFKDYLFLRTKERVQSTAARGKEFHSSVQGKSISLLWSKATDDNNEHRVTKKSCHSTSALQGFTLAYWTCFGCSKHTAIPCNYSSTLRRKRSHEEMQVKNLSADNMYQPHTSLCLEVVIYLMCV